MPTAHEIIEWAQAGDIVDSLLALDIDLSIVRMESDRRQDDIRLAIAERSQVLLAGSETYYQWLLVEQEALQLKIQNTAEEVSILRDCSLERVSTLDVRIGAEAFCPFSIPTIGIRKYGASYDEGYVTIRDAVMDSIFPPNGELLSQGEAKARKQTAGMAINRILRLADPQLTRYDWLEPAIAEANAIGIEVHPGRGISFNDPDKIYDAFVTNTGPAKGGVASASPNKNFIHFAKSLAS